ncbi:MAG TPA: rod shape-determining protein MreC, partial [Sphingobacteriaceae bacterium]
NAFFFFIIFFAVSFILLVNNNSFQKSSSWNSSNQLVGQIYQQANEFESYVKLGKTNDSLAAENARLRSQLKASLYDDSVVEKTVKDTTTRQQYTYIVAQVVNNSIHRQNNYLTVNRGTRHGIRKGMGVIGPNGVVGIVRDVTENFARIQSLLHSETRFSAMVDGNIGSMVWGDNNIDPQRGTLKDIPNHIVVRKGARVVTSGFSLFPKNVPIGQVISSGTKGGDSFLNVEVRLATDFGALEYVYVVNNILAAEQETLESENNPK